MIFKIIIKVLLACVFLQFFAGCGVNEYIEKYNQLKTAQHRARFVILGIPDYIPQLREVTRVN